MPPRNLVPLISSVATCIPSWSRVPEKAATPVSERGAPTFTVPLRLLSFCVALPSQAVSRIPAIAIAAPAGLTQREANERSDRLNFINPPLGIACACQPTPGGKIVHH